MKLKIIPIIIGFGILLSSCGNTGASALPVGQASPSEITQQKHADAKKQQHIAALRRINARLVMNEDKAIALSDQLCVKLKGLSKENALPIVKQGFGRSAEKNPELILNALRLYCIR